MPVPCGFCHNQITANDKVAMVVMTIDAPMQGSNTHRMYACGDCHGKLQKATLHRLEQGMRAAIVYMKDGEPDHGSDAPDDG